MHSLPGKKKYKNKEKIHLIYKEHEVPPLEQHQSLSLLCFTSIINPLPPSFVPMHNPIKCWVVYKNCMTGVKPLHIIFSEAGWLERMQVRIFAAGTLQDFIYDG